MADRILINTEEYRRIGGSLQTLSDELSDCAAALGRVTLTDDAGGDLPINLGGTLRTVTGSMPDGQLRNVVPQMCGLIKRLGAYSDQLARSARQASDLFEETERKLAAMQMSQSQKAVFSDGGGGGGGSSNAQSQSVDWPYKMPGIFHWDNGKPQQIIEGGSSLIYGPGGLAIVAIGKISAIFDGSTAAMGHVTNSMSLSLGCKEEQTLERPRDLFRKNGGGENPLENRLSLFDLSVESSTSESLFHFDGQRAGENGDVKSSVDFFKTTTKGKIFGGLGAVNENGEFKLSPGFGAEVGASGTIFENTTSFNYELIDNVNMSGNLTTSVGKVSAEGKAFVGFMDGELNAYGEVGAEALAYELKGDVDVNIGGVKGTVGASINYGIGAKAKIGFYDGKLVYDVGATIGVGGSIYGEIDVSGLVDNVAEGARQVGENIAEGARQVGENIAEGARQVGENIAEGARQVGENIAEGAKQAGDYISGFCERAWDFWLG